MLLDEMRVTSLPPPLTRDALEVGEQELEKLLAVLLRPSLKRQRVREPSGVGVPMRT